MEITNKKFVGFVKPVANAVRTWKKNTSSINASVAAALYYAKRDDKNYVIVAGNSYMRPVYHITNENADLFQFGILNQTRIVIVQPDGNVYEATAK